MDSGLSMTQSVLIPGAANATAGTGYFLYSTGQTQHNNVENDAITDGAVGDAGDVWQCAFDADAGKLWFGKNDTWGLAGVGADPASGDDSNYSSIPTGRNWVPGTTSYNDGDSENFPQNFGQDGTFFGRITAGGNADGNGIGNFKYAPPSGFLALCAGNLSVAAGVDPAKDVDNGTLYQALTYTGNGSNSRAITTNFDPDAFWFKRLTTKQWFITSKRRGIGDTTYYDWFQGTDHDGYQTGDYKGVVSTASTSMTIGAVDYVNEDGGSYVVSLFNYGGTESTNNDGNLESTIYANAGAGMSHGTYTGTGATKTVGHGLGAVPSFIITRSTSQGSNWAVYYGDNTDALLINSGAGTADANYWADTTPSSSVFTVGNNADTGAAAGYIFWAFADTVGFIKSGIYTGIANADGAFIYTGFKPALLIIKRATGTESWFMMDDARDPANVVEGVLQMNGSNGESRTDYDVCDIVSNGFKLRISNVGFNAAETFVYLAIGSNPFKYATAR
jgi:hypothetical protein